MKTRKALHDYLGNDFGADSCIITVRKKGKITIMHRIKVDNIPLKNIRFYRELKGLTRSLKFPLTRNRYSFSNSIL